VKDIKVKRAALLKKIRLNREKHREVFLKAQKKYRREVIRLLDEKLSLARAGKHFDQSITLPVPQDHSDDYDRAIAMLEMETRDEIEVSEADFAVYVLDQWSWRKAWATSTASYVLRKPSD
jgi:hypothetical protein